MSAVIDYLGNRKVPLTLVAAFLLSMWQLHEWADIHYMPSAVASEANVRMEGKIGDLVEQVKQNSTAIESHNRDYRRNENKKAIDLVQDQQFNLIQYANANGSSQLIVERTEELRRKLEDLKDIKTCLANGNEDCD